MSTAVQALLNSFNALTEAEQHEAAVEVLRRAVVPVALPDDALITAADEVFRQMDAQESVDARP